MTGADMQNITPSLPPLPNPQVYSSPLAVTAALWNFAAAIWVTCSACRVSTRVGAAYVGVAPVPSW